MFELRKDRSLSLPPATFSSVSFILLSHTRTSKHTIAEHTENS